MGTSDIDSMNEEELQEIFIYPYRIKWKDSRLISTENQPLLSLIQQYDWTEQDVNEAIQPIYRHPLGRKFLSTLSIEEKVELLKEAEELLVAQLSRGGK